MFLRWIAVAMILLSINKMNAQTLRHYSLMDLVKSYEYGVVALNHFDSLAKSDILSSKEYGIISKCILKQLTTLVIFVAAIFGNCQLCRAQSLDTLDSSIFLHLGELGNETAIFLRMKSDNIIEYNLSNVFKGNDTLIIRQYANEVIVDEVKINMGDLELDKPFSYSVDFFGDYYPEWWHYELIRLNNLEETDHITSIQCLWKRENGEEFIKHDHEIFSCANAPNYPVLFEGTTSYSIIGSYSSEHIVYIETAFPSDSIEVDLAQMRFFVYNSQGERHDFSYLVQDLHNNEGHVTLAKDGGEILLDLCPVTSEILNVIGETSSRGLFFTIESCYNNKSITMGAQYMGNHNLLCD